MALFFDPFRMLDRVAGSVFDRPTLMPVDLYRDGDHFVLKADLPGVDPGSVDVSVDGETLTIRAERRAPDVRGVQWLTQERPDAAFLRQFALGTGIDTDAIDATYDNGVLTVLIPMSEQAKPRRIAVSATGRAVRLEEGGSASGTASASDEADGTRAEAVPAGAASGEERVR